MYTRITLTNQILDVALTRFSTSEVQKSQTEQDPITSPIKDHRSANDPNNQGIIETDQYNSLNPCVVNCEAFENFTAVPIRCFNFSKLALFDAVSNTRNIYITCHVEVML